jgi:L-fucose isomerase
MNTLFDGDLPKVGIRPTIDGRLGGVRESIGGVAEAAACAEKFRRENVGVSLTVTPCWCYGSETMDMDPLTPKAVWGFNGTERPGAVYLAAVLAGHTQKGLPAFGIYGRDVQDGGDKEIPADVEEKILRFARAGMAVALMPRDAGRGGGHERDHAADRARDLRSEGV